MGHSNSNKQYQNLDEFVTYWDNYYLEQLKEISLFNTQLTQHWSNEQKQLFAKVFYHLRGHFYEFLWLMGNYAPNLEAKEIVLKNISEEFGESRRSHEQLYFDFAKVLGVDIESEIITENGYLNFAKQFNRGHIKWLIEHSWNEKQAAFSAYERLDNVDYPYLFSLAQSFGLPDKDLVFFRAHIKVHHYEATESLLKEVWQQDSESVIKGFSFIYSHQLAMWRNLSDCISARSLEKTGEKYN